MHTTRLLANLRQKDKIWAASKIGFEIRSRSVKSSRVHHDAVGCDAGSAACGMVKNGLAHDRASNSDFS